MDTLEAYKATTLDIIRQHLSDYSARIAEDTTCIKELEKDGNWNHEQAIACLLYSLDITKAKRVALLSLKRDLEVQHLL